MSSATKNMQWMDANELTEYAAELTTLANMYRTDDAIKFVGVSRDEAISTVTAKAARCIAKAQAMRQAVAA